MSGSASLASPFAVAAKAGSPSAARRPLRRGCAVRTDGYRRLHGRRSGVPRPLFVPGVAGSLLLALAQLGLVGVADVAEPRSARPVLAPVLVAACFELAQ